MTTIVLLDNDNVALEVLAPAIAALRPEWIIHPLTVGQHALELVKNDTVDVVVTENTLSDFTGFELLDQMRSANGHVIRFTLSSELEAELVLESTRVNHRFIAKPVEAQELVANIEGSLRLRLLMTNEQLRLRMRRVKTIPSLPEIYDEMTRELASANSSLVKVAEIVESDVGLTATVLKIVNSAFYGLNRRVESVAQAVTFLGVHLIKNITLTAKVFSRSEGNVVSLKRLSELNEQAIRMGALSNQFARYAKLSKIMVDHCQIAGMMCNVGELIGIADEEADEDREQIPASLLGAYLLRSWMMSDSVVEAIALQHEKPSAHSRCITPHMVLHSIRYLQEHCTSGATAEQRELCLCYLTEFAGRPLAEIWLDAYQALTALTPDDVEQAA